ncbi:caspase family protein [Planctomycetes bacterium K23_9]|uniref:Caspase domain protein n=1 Tax=Stieleria marina TaxID=1930275 RepID=A0A517NLV0_9BACT|nr:Caspase domain protein [Planctomycetes bacterium K23_9]
MNNPARFVFWIVSTSFAVAFAAPDVSAERFGILIGIDQYASLPPSQQLRGCVNDVSLVKQMLGSDQAYKPGNLTVLTNSMATRSAILNALQATLEKVQACNQSGEPARVVFHFSGHGSQAMDQLQGPMRDEPSYFDQTIVPHDADRQGGQQDIRDDELRHWAHSIASDPTNRLLVILDCCHSGTGLRGGGTGERVRHRRLDRSLPSPPVDQFAALSTEAELPNNVGFISACRSDQLEPETESAGQPHGLLTLSLARVCALIEQGSPLPMTRLANLLHWHYQLEDHLGLLPEPQVEISGAMAGEPFWLTNHKAKTDSGNLRDIAMIRFTPNQKDDGDSQGFLQRGILDSIQTGTSFPIFTSAKPIAALASSRHTIGTATIDQVGFDQSRVSVQWNDHAPVARPDTAWASIETGFVSKDAVTRAGEKSPGQIASDRLTQIIAQHVAARAPSDAAIRTGLVIGKRSGPDAKTIQWAPAKPGLSGRPQLDTGDIYIIEVQHDLASDQDLFATIVHIDPNHEVSLMCPRSFTQPNIERQRIDATRGVRSSGFVCNGDALLPRDDPEFRPAIVGLHRAIVFVGPRPLDLSSLFQFLHAPESTPTRSGAFTANPNSAVRQQDANGSQLKIDFFSSQSSAIRGQETATSNLWWDAHLVQWISQ